MSLLNKASLIQIPSGYKDGTLYSAKPTNGDGDFTFSRGSNLAATRVNSEGLIEKGRENILYESNNFSSGYWNYRAGDSSTGGQAGYDDTNDAWLLSVNNGGWSVYQNYVGTGVHTFSLYVKAGTANIIQIDLFSASTTYSGQFNLSNGTDAGGSNSIDRNIISVGGGWYRVSFAANISSTLYARIGTVTQTGNFYIQDAQLEQGLVATDYIETTTTTEQAGILEDMPRLDYSGGASCPSLLLEPQRINYIPQSEPFSGGDWISLGGATIVSNASVSPQGVQNAAEVQGTSGSSFIYDVLNLTASTAHTTSFYIKNNDSTTTQFWAANESAYSINWDGLTIDSVDSGVYYESVGNDWYRVWSTADSNSDGQFITRFYPSNSVASVYLYGYQVEEGSYPTSYIPTYGASVTRGQDDCNKTGISSLIGQTEGTFFAEIDSSQFLTGSYIGISDGGTTNRQIFGWEANSGDSGTLRLYGFWNGFAYSSFSKGEKIKIALAYKTNDFALYVNGTQAGTNTSASTSGTLSQFGFNSGGGAQKYQGNVYQALLFPTRLSNDELASLTTI